MSEARRPAHRPARGPVPVGAAGRTAAGFTLLETVLSTAIGAVVLLALGSSVLIASYALPPRGRAVDASVAAADAAERFLADVQFAKTIVTMERTRLAFTVADRTGDGVDDTIEYAATGDPTLTLARRFNAGLWESLTTGLATAEFTPTLRPATLDVEEKVTAETGEITLEMFTGWSGVSATTQTNAISDRDWAAQGVLLVPPREELTSVEFTGVRLVMAAGTAAGTVSVAVFPSAGGGVPTGSSLGPATTIASSTLARSSAPVAIPLTGTVITSDFAREVVLRVRGSAPSVATLSSLRGLLAPSIGHVFRWTSNAGSTWQPTISLSQNDAPFALLGRYRYPRAAVIQVPATRVASMTVTLGVPGVGTRVEAGGPVLNEPLVP